MKRISEVEFISKCDEYIQRLDLKSMERESLDFKDDNGCQWHISKDTLPSQTGYTNTIDDLEVHVTCRYSSRNGIKGLMRCRWCWNAFIYKCKGAWKKDFMYDKECGGDVYKVLPNSNFYIQKPFRN